jgi:hypothetical protein
MNVQRTGKEPPARAKQSFDPIARASALPADRANGGVKQFVEAGKAFTEIAPVLELGACSRSVCHCHVCRTPAALSPTGRYQRFTGFSFGTVHGQGNTSVTAGPCAGQADSAEYVSALRKLISVIVGTAGWAKPPSENLKTGLFGVLRDTESEAQTKARKYLEARLYWLSLKALTGASVSIPQTGMTACCSNRRDTRSRLRAPI